MVKHFRRGGRERGFGVESLFHLSEKRGANVPAEEKNKSASPPFKK